MEIIKGRLNEKKKERAKKKQFLCNKYKKLYESYLYGIDGHDFNVEKALLFGIKYIVSVDVDTETEYEQFLRLMITIQDIVSLLGNISYRKFIEMFPIIKEYDGKKWECKDYFSTMEYLNTKDLNQLIGNDGPELIWQYYNYDVMNFGVKQCLIQDRLLRVSGRKGLLESFFDEVAPGKEITTYTIHKKEGYIYNNKTGKTEKLRKPRKRKPKYINII